MNIRLQGLPLGGCLNGWGCTHKNVGNVIAVDDVMSIH